MNYYRVNPILLFYCPQWSLVYKDLVSPKINFIPQIYWFCLIISFNLIFLGHIVHLDAA